MAEIARPIWPGSGSFFPNTDQTAFGYFDNDYQFQQDSEKVARFCAVRLGYPITDIELQEGNFYTAFEEAVIVYGNEIYNQKVKDNYLGLEGTSTSSLLNNQVINPNLGGIIRIAENYGSEAGAGGFTTYYTGSITLVPQQQNYNLNQWAQASASLIPGDSIEVKRIFHQGPPASVRFYDPYVGAGAGYQSMYEAFGFGNLSPAVSFTLHPIYFDLEKIQAIEFNDTVRRSAYSFDLVNNQLRIFPVPTFEHQFFFHYIKRSERDSPINSNFSGSNGSLVSNPSNVPYTNIVYSQINSIGRQWIFQYTLAIAKEMLGWIRQKYSVIPIPGSEVTLNGTALVTDGTQMKKDLLESLRGMLDETGRKKQLENKQAEAESEQSILGKVPMPFFIG